ncbi:hypothetical protein GW17_00009434 [Ensete ventricosum]|nr:hypothetical protein GW17_00009434 [Ensete ventricosum]
MRGEDASPLLHPAAIPERGFEEEDRLCCSLGLCNDVDVVAEARRLLSLAGPLIAASLLQYSLQLISIMFVGHLGELNLSGASMATSFANVSGFSVLVSGQNPEISAEAGTYACCVEFWSFEMVVLLSGLLPDPKLETSVLSIRLVTIISRLYSIFASLNTMWMVYMIPTGLSSAVRFVEFSLLCAARGCGWQKYCSFVNLGAYYVVGIPSAIMFAFFLHIGGKVCFSRF